MVPINTLLTFFTLGLSLVLVTGLGGCDDAPEESKQEAHEHRQKMMRDKLQQKDKEAISLPLLSFNMQHNGQSITLSDGDRDKILRITDILCNAVRSGGKTLSETYKTKVGELTGELEDLGYSIVSLKIIKGSGELGSHRQEIDVRIKNKQTSMNCSIDQFKPKDAE